MILLLITTVVALYVAMGAILYPSLKGFVRLQFSYSGSQFESIYGGWTELQKLRYSLHFWLDYPFLVAYGWLGYLLAIALSEFQPMSSATSAVVPTLLPLAAVADAIENLLHQQLVRQTERGKPSNTMALCAGVAATTKWGLLATYLLFLMISWQSLWAFLKLVLG